MTLEKGPGSTSEAEILRPEARPLPYSQLDEQQQAALRRVLGLLTTAVQGAPTPTSDSIRAVQALPAPSGPYLESARRSRNILIGGERGTGKTTLMLSLASVLATERDAELGESLPEDEDVANQARQLRRRLAWLETLDMESLASEANLLGAVLARVEDAVGARFPVDNTPETVSLLHPGAGFHDMSRELARLQTSVALSFGGNLGKRGGSLDPDTFAVESRRAERERLGLDRRFASVLAGLSSAMTSTVPLTAPVFVLPVDDVDLNVSDCVPLLRLLRATSSPHLIVVLAADVDLLLTILRLSYQGDLARISTPAPFSEDDKSIAADLATNALRKHLPPAQRVVLGLVEPGRALALKPLGSTMGSVGQVLGRITFRADSAALQLDSYFSPTMAGPAMQPAMTSPSWSAGPEEKPAQLSERLALFSWPQVLRLSMRQLVDLYMDCTVRAKEQQQHAPTHHAADSPLVELVRQRMQALLPVNGTGSLSFNGSLGPVVATRLGEAPAVGTQPWQGWQVSAPGQPPIDMTGAAVLAGCIDLLGDEWQAAANDPTQPYLQTVRSTLWPASATSSERWVGWPWVTHSTFWGYERALAWLAEADKLWTDEQDAAFGSWVAVMTAQLFHAPDQMQPLGQPTRPFADDWNSLAERLGDLGQTPLAEAWLDAAGLLCTPEMGMRFPVPAFLPAWRAEHVQALRTQRATGLPPPLQSLLDSGPQEAEKAESKGAPRPSPGRNQRSASAPEGPRDSP